MRVIRGRPRPTVRLRLTLLYGVLFFTAGVLLLVVNFTLLRESLTDRVNESRGVVSTQLMSDGPMVTSVTIPEAGESPAAGGSGSTELTAYQSALHEAAVHSVIHFQNDFRDAALNSMLVQSGIAVVVTGLAALGFGWLVAGRVLRPISEVTNTARRASESNLHARVNLAGPADELKELADTFDHMLRRLETSFESQRRFAADASHELRTPIAIIQAEADVMLAEPDVTARERRLAESVQSAAQRGERLIASLLALARSQSTFLEKQRLDLADLTGGVIGELLPRAAAREIQLDLELADAIVIGDPVLLDRLVTNLVDNALHHNIPQGWVDVSVTASGHAACLRVANSGPQVRGNDIAMLFEPFKRQANDREPSPLGFGLGLTIVRSIVLSHGGVVAAVPRAEGGLEVTVELPAAPALADPTAGAGPGKGLHLPARGAA